MQRIYIKISKKILCLECKFTVTFSNLLYLFMVRFKNIIAVKEAISILM